MSIMVSRADDVDTTRVELAVLGTFQARVDGVWTQAPTRQVARVATVLAGWPGEPVDRERIMAAVWGEKMPATANNTLQVHVSHLRRLLGRDAVRSQGSCYSLDIAPEAVDTERFIEAVHEAARMRRKQHFARAAEYLDTALALWRGTPFSDVSDPDLTARRAKLTELRDQAKEDLLECRLELARDQFELADVVAEARELVSRQPQREKGHALLVRALAAADRPGEASAAFEFAQERMRTTQGLDPGRELVSIHAMSLHHNRDVYPRAMRAINGIPSARRITVAHRATAQRARGAVVDLGARIVTVTAADPADGKPLATAIGEALIGDLPTGVLVLAGSDANLAGLDAALKRVTEGDQTDIRAVKGLAALAAIVVAEDGTVGQPFCDAFDEWAEAPRLVVISPAALDCDAEVVIVHNTQHSPPGASRGHGV